MLLIQDQTAGLKVLDYCRFPTKPLLTPACCLCFAQRLTSVWAPERTAVQLLSLALSVCTVTTIVTVQTAPRRSPLGPGGVGR